jgi:hypothetical protein
LSGNFFTVVVTGRHDTNIEVFCTVCSDCMVLLLP